MKKLISLPLFVILLSVFFISCKPTKEELDKNIAEYEKNLSVKLKESNGTEYANELYEFYSDYIKYYPEEPIVHEITHKAAMLAMDFGASANAINLFEKYLENEPDEEKQAQTLFYMGFIYENQVYDLVNADVYYRKVIEKFPNSSIAPNVKVLLENLGKEPEEFIKKEEADSSSTNEKPI
ncbi:MAG: tetratricopeptide repeat protein [Bacteroidales bacterium]|nr:tetratricopeptide repeat protein [Bacteroidales bacterium]